MSNSPPPYIPSSPHPHKPNLSPFYYGLVVVGATAVVLALYNLLVVGLCALRQRQNPPLFWNRRLENSSSELVSTVFNYSEKEKRGVVDECSVCLTCFEDGEEVRELSRCGHSFHVACIDMWLYSHWDCLLCRAVVGPPSCHNLVVLDDDSREVLRGDSNLV